MSQDKQSVQESNKPSGTKGSGRATTSLDSKKDKYAKKMKEQLEHLNTKLDEIEAEVRGFSAETRKKYDQQMTHLRQMAKSANKQLEGIKDVSEDQWDRLVTEGDKVQKAFVHSYNYFKSQMK